MLSELIPDLRELIDLTRKAENFDATLAAHQQLGKPIEPAAHALVDRARLGERIVQLTMKWGIR